MSYGLEGSEQLSHLASAFWVLLLRIQGFLQYSRDSSGLTNPPDNDAQHLVSTRRLSFVVSRSFLFFPARFQ